MDQFMKLPPAQKAAVLAAVLAVIGVGLYFLLVDPELVRAEQNRNNLRRVDQEIVSLQTDATPEERERLRKLKDELLEQDKENRKMLPNADEIPDFVEGVQKDAVQVGLEVRRFERNQEENHDLYNATPIKMTVEGSMLEFMQFLRIYAGPERRVVNLRDLNVEQLPADQQKLKAQLQALKPQETAAKGATVAAKTPEEVLLESIEIAEQARKNQRIRATFVAYAFTWTGKPAVKVEGVVEKKKQKKKRT